MSVSVPAVEPVSVNENPPRMAPPRVSDPSPTSTVVFDPRVRLLAMVAAVPTDRLLAIDG